MKHFAAFYCLSGLLFAVVLSSCGEKGQTSSSASTVEKSSNPSDSFRTQLLDYVKARNLHIGIGISCFENKDTLSVNGNEHYSLMSVCKFPQAITLLHLQDEGKLARNAMVHITQEDFKQPTMSSLQKDHPHIPFDMTIPEAFSYSIGQSDNVSSNVIFALEGGPAAVQDYIRSLGIAEIGVATDYWHMKNDSVLKNWITPVAAVTLLDKFFNQKILSDSSKAILWNAMVTATNGKNRLPGLLPAGSIIGHKTGTSGRDGTNTTTAFNDIGIMVLPNGKHVAVAVFIANTRLSDDDNAKVIAEIGKMVWDHYQAQ